MSVVSVTIANPRPFPVLKDSANANGFDDERLKDQNYLSTSGSATATQNFITR